MTTPKQYRSSLERHNAPYRGVSSKQDYVNFQLGVTHDLLHAYNLSGGQEGIAGHRDNIQDNLSAIFNGDRNISPSSYSAGTITSIKEEEEEASDLSNWTIPPLTYGEIEHARKREWRLLPPETDRGFFELEYLLRVSSGERYMIRFKPQGVDPSTVYAFGALNVDSAGDDMKALVVDDEASFLDLTSSYFEHILRFDEEREVRLAIRTQNTPNGTLNNTPLTLQEFGVYKIEEIPVYTRSLEDDIKPQVADQRLRLQHIEERSVTDVT